MLLKVVIVSALIFAGIIYYTANFQTQSKPDNPNLQSPPQINNQVQTLSANLEIPWEIAFLPDKTLFITERKGIVWQLDGTNKKNVLELNDVAHIGEGGLLGLAHHPDHEKNGFTYLYYTYNQNGLKNKVVRYSHIGDTLTLGKIIIQGIPGNKFHNGGRIKFGPDNKLYITTGDSENPSTAQDLNTLAGKILRLNDDGSIPSDNPFSNSPVYSYGHRNPQGLAWDSKGQLWETEHGQSALDEVNIILPGKNYGWPDIRGDQEKEGMEKPFLHSGNDTWAPSGVTIIGNKLLFAGLRSSTIFSLDIQTKELKEYFKNQYGRLRTVIEGPDKNLYFLTNNRDGRGKPTTDDDRLLKVPPDIFGL